MGRGTLGELIPESLGQADLLILELAGADPAERGMPVRLDKQENGIPNFELSFSLKRPRPNAEISCPRGDFRSTGR